MSDEDENGNGNGDGNGDEKVYYKKKDGIEKDGYMCYPISIQPDKDPDVPDEPDTPPPPPVKYDLETCPEDPRFQQMNKTKWCSRMYVDYHRCRYLLGDKADQCNYFYKCYNSICPNSWVDKWDEQRTIGSFPVDVTHDLPPPAKQPCP